MKKEKLKIFIWSPIINPGGGERLLFRLISAINKNPQINHVTFLGPKNDAFQDLLINQNITVASSPKLNQFSAFIKKLRLPNFFTRQLLSWVTKLEDRNLQNILRFYSGQNDVTYVFWPHRNKYPDGLLNRVVCSTIQDVTFFDFPELLGWEQTQDEKMNISQWLKCSSQVIVSSENSLKRILFHFDNFITDVKIIRHDILPDSLDVLESVDVSRFKLPENYIVFPSNIMPHKNHYNLFLAWAKFSQRTNISLVLFGGGTDALNPDYQGAIGMVQSRLRGVLLRCGLFANKDFFSLGYIPDKYVLPIIRNAKALIMPTLSEGGGSYPIEEALSLGVPVLCSDIPVLREHARGHSAKIGWFDPNSPDSIARALNDLVENYSVYKQSALDAVNDPRPNWDDIAEHYVDAFCAVLQKRGNLANNL
jgi:glycosyltransferase involved in cell wall biosynthesis